MWNSLTVLYLALSSIATALLVAGAIAGLRMALKWPRGAPAGEARDDYDRQHHLIVTLMRVGTVAGVLVAPLWFGALASLVPAIPGGMCMASVHALGSPTSWVASSLKAAVPALLVYWLVVDRAERRRDDGLLVRHEQRLLLPVALASLASTGLDLQLLFGLELRPSACCMTLFDGPSLANGPDGVPGWGWTVTLGAAIGVLGLAFAVGRVRALAEVARLATLVAAPVVLVSLVLALHTRLGSALMGTDHHCIFCAWKEAPASFAATLLVAVGAWWLTARAALAGALRRASGERVPMRYATPFGLVVAGAAALAALAVL